jgi:hypothetical protein
VTKQKKVVDNTELKRIKKVHDLSEQSGSCIGYAVRRRRWIGYREKGSRLAATKYANSPPTEKRGMLI